MTLINRIGVMMIWIPIVIGFCLPFCIFLSPKVPLLFWKTMRWHLLWYVPLGIIILWYITIHDILWSIGAARIVLDHFIWALYFSPSAYLYFSILGSIPMTPLLFFIFIPVLFEKDSVGYKHKRRWLWTLVLLAMVPVSALFLHIILWGSFPFIYLEDGYERLRMNPFIPWPNTPFWG